MLETITIRNTTPQGGSQAEALFTGAQRVLVNRVNLLSRQDTLLTNIGTAFITDSYIEGNTDFMWGTAAAYYQRCELKALDTTDVPMTAHPIPVSNAFREDTVRPSLGAEKVLANAPQPEGDYFRVPKILES